LDFEQRADVSLEPVAAADRGGHDDGGSGPQGQGGGTSGHPRRGAEEAHGHALLLEGSIDQDRQDLVLAERVQHLPYAALKRDRTHAGQGAYLLDSLVPALRGEGLNDNVDRIAARGQEGAGQVPVADVGRHHHQAPAPG
jgi:hypothetical protein